MTSQERSQGDAISVADTFGNLTFFRDTCAHLPDEMMLVADLQTAPDGSNAKLAAIAAAHSGSLSEGERAVRPIKSFGPPVMDALGPIPYSALNTMLDPAFPKGARNNIGSTCDAVSLDAPDGHLSLASIKKYRQNEAKVQGLQNRMKVRRDSIASCPGRTA